MESLWAVFCRGLHAITLYFLISGNSLATENMYFHGALVAEPCVIPPGMETIELDFGNIVDKYLYLNQRTQGLPLVIRLAECDLSLAKTVTLTFIGTESPSLPGLLLPETGSLASGIAIGFETSHGDALPLNKAGVKYPLQDGTTDVHLRAYVQGEPQAIIKRNINLGMFSAVATFSLSYE